MEITTPRTLAVVVDSDVLKRKVAVSVPLAEHIEMEDRLWVNVSRHLVEDAVRSIEAEFEQRRSPQPHSTVEIDRDRLLKQAELLVLRGDTTWDEIGAACGWTRQDEEYANGRRGDGQKVRELLTRKRDLTFDEANALVKAIGLDPVDVGL